MQGLATQYVLNIPDAPQLTLRLVGDFGELMGQLVVHRNKYPEPEHYQMFVRALKFLEAHFTESQRTQHYNRAL